MPNSTSLDQWPRPEREITVQFAPGRACRARVPSDKVPRLVLARLVPKGGGEYQLVPVSFDPWVRLTERLPKDLGLDCDSRVLRRWAMCDFIKGRVLGPLITQIELGSLYDFLEAVRIDAPTPFWTAERVKLYREVNGSIKDGVF